MTKPAIPSLSNLPAPIQRVLSPIRDEIIKLSDRIVEQEAQITSLEELLRGSKATRTITGPGSLPPVTGYRVVTSPNSITIYLSAVGAGATTVASPQYVTELWRGIGPGSSSDSALLVRETTRFALEDHPPPGETYRYWLRYRSLDGSATGPFTPANGITLVTAEAANPEDLFDPTNGGVFLETFEGEDFPARWVRRQGGGTTIDYQLSGVVGGKVVRIAGGEEWRAYATRFEFDPSVLYRMKVGLRMSALPTNGATNARALLRAGFECYDANGNLVDTAGGSGFTGAHFFCAFDRDYGAAGVSVYQEFEGYIRGLGGAPTNNASNVAQPSVARNGTRYFAPVIAVNYAGGNGTTEIDYIRIDALTPYSLSLSAILTNDAVVVPADSSGSVLSYAPATGEFQLYLGLTRINPTNITFGIGDNPQGLTATIDADGLYAVTNGFDSGEDYAEIEFTALFSGVTLTRKFNLAKGRQGVTGPPGGPGDSFTGYLTRTTWPILVRQNDEPITGAFDGANGRFLVFESGADVTASATFSVVAFNCTGTINTDVNTPVSGQPRGYFRVTDISGEAGTLTMTATYSGRNFTAIFTVNRQRVGYEIFSTLPTTGNYEGRVVYLTTDGRLYRYNSGAWTAAVPASSVTGLLTASQIDTITAAQLTGTLIASQIASITAPQITGTLTDAQLAAIAAAKITGTLTASQIASIASTQITGQLTSSQIASITAAQLTGQIVGTQIVDGAINTQRLAAGAVTASTIAANTITAAQIAAATITATQLAAGSVTAAQLAAGAVTAGSIAAGAVTTTALAAGSVTAANIVAGTITGDRIAANTITGDQIASRSIVATNLQAGAVTAFELAAGAVIAGKIAAGAVTATEIAAGTITAGQIAALTITAAQIAANTITAAQIAANTITGDRIQAGAITTALLAAGAVTAVNIAAGTITTTELQAGGINGDRITVGTLNGDRIIAGTITATSIQAGTITADRLVLGGVSTDRLAPGATINFASGAGTTTFTTAFTTVATATITPADANSTVLAMFSGTVIIGDAAPTTTSVNARLLRNGTDVVWGPTRVSASRGIPIPFSSFVTRGGETTAQTFALQLQATLAPGLGDPHSVENARVLLLDFKR